MTETETESARRVARDAALQSLVSNAVYLGIMVGFTVALAKRDWVARQWMRAKKAWRGGPEKHGAAMADFRSEISRLEHGG